MEQAGRADYIALNEALKARAEAAVAVPETTALHPALPLTPDSASPGPVGVLRCRCPQDAVEVHVGTPAVHSHLCGCTQCWKPEGALFALTSVVPADAVKTVAHGEKLAIVDNTKAIRRHACQACGAHMHGEVCDADHHFFGLAFIHPELGSAVPPAPEFAGFVSSIIESGVSPTRMVAIRAALRDQGITACDAFSPEIMDLIAWHRVKLAREARG
jgi:S-(hydroxymethyl)glutathione synthase